MKAVLANAPPESLLVVRLGAMGDIIHTLAPVSALRTAFPHMRIGWVVEERWSELLCVKRAHPSGARSPSRPIVDFVHVVDTKRWRKSLLSRQVHKQFSAAWREIRDQEYEVVVDFQGAIKSAFIARLGGAETVVGFEHPRELPARIFYGQRVAARGVHVIEQYHWLAEAAAGRSLPACEIAFPNDEAAEAKIQSKVAALGKKFILISPGAGWGAKQWPAERYGEVAASLAADGLIALINFGPGEQELARSVEAASAGAARPICCSIPELIALTRQSSLFIGGDTGPLHLAAALRVPVVAIFGPTDPARNGPYGKNRRSTVLRDPGSKTSLSHTGMPDSGLLNIAAEKVIRAARQLLEAPGA